MKTTTLQTLYRIILFTLLLLLFPAVYSQYLLPDIQINNSDDPLLLTPEDFVTLSIQLDTFDSTDSADWFMAVNTPAGLFCLAPEGWTNGLAPIVQGPVQSFPNTELMTFPAAALPSGDYAFYFALDTHMDGLLSLEQFYFDSAEFTILRPLEQKRITANEGGSLRIMNGQGDIITLMIPPLALPQTSTIALQAIDVSQNNPIKKTIIPGVRIKPDGLMLRKPARLRVQLAGEGVNTEKALFFYQKQSDFVIPLGEQVAIGTFMEGEIYHFSDFICGEPDEKEAGEQSQKVTNLDSDDPLNWQSVAEQSKGALGWAAYCMKNDCNVDTTFLFDAARNIAEQKVRDFLNLPIPNEPSDAYLDALLNYKEMLKAINGDQTLRDALEDHLNQIGGGPAMFELEWWDDKFSSDGGKYSTKPNRRIPFRLNITEHFNLFVGGGTLTYHTTYPCILGECTCHRYVHVTIPVSGILYYNPDRDHPWGEFTVEVNTYEKGEKIITKSCPGNVIEQRRHVIDAGIITWVFPFRDGAYVFDNSAQLPPRFHIIRWDEPMKEELVADDY